MLAEDLWRLFDIIGTLAFAVSGTLVGISRRMDIFGISVLALATAVGGGMVRDMLVGITPPMALRNTTNFLLSVGVALLTSLLYQRTALHHMRRRRLLTMFNVSDTIGLAAFTITGALTGVRFGGDDSYVLPVLLAATTAVGGGMIRDVLAQRMPVVLYAEVYAPGRSCSACCVLRSAWRRTHGSRSLSYCSSDSLRSAGTGVSTIRARRGAVMTGKRRNSRALCSTKTHAHMIFVIKRMGFLC